MPDNSTKIAEIKAILESGATQVMVDGEMVSYDHASLRKQLRELIRTDTTLGGSRPVLTSINLSGTV